MKQTVITHGDLCITFHSDSDIQITRQSNAQSLLMSASEWAFLLRCADLRGWPVISTGDVEAIYARQAEEAAKTMRDK